MTNSYVIDGRALSLIRNFQVEFFRADGLATAVIPPGYDFDTFTPEVFDCESLSEDHAAFLSQLYIFFQHAKFSAGTYAINAPVAHTSARADLPDEGFGSSIEVCDHHLQLLKSAIWYLHVMADKRPFGDSSYIYNDMARIIGIEVDPSMLKPDGSFNADLEKKLNDILCQLPMVLKAFIQHGQLALGNYDLPDGDLRILRMQINL